MIQWTRALLALLLVCGSVNRAAACTTWVGYRVPTNFELVYQADLIVLGRIRPGAERAPAAEPAIPGKAASLTVDQQIGSVLLEPVRVLKGEWSGVPLRLSGSTTTGARPQRSIPGVPVTPVFTSLSEVNPWALAGGCVRGAFPSGGLVVVMFEQAGTGMRMISAPFARAAEDVEGPNALWVRAVDAYIKSQRGVQPSRLREAATRQRNLYRAQKSDPFAQALAADLLEFLRAKAKAP